MSATAHAQVGSGRRRDRNYGHSRWRPLEIAAIVLGFIIWWVLGLALLIWKLVRSRRGQPADIIEAARSFEEKVMHTWPEKARSWGCGSNKRRRTEAAAGNWGFSSGSARTGNSAFDEWRDGELSRLDEERRKLENAAREFADYVESLRKAKDREEFDHFMRERRNGAGNNNPGNKNPGNDGPSPSPYTG